MERSNFGGEIVEDATHIANFLKDHPRVRQV